jgi:hypothetical protein
VAANASALTSCFITTSPVPKRPPPRNGKRLSLALAIPSEAGDFLGLRLWVDGTNGRLMPPASQFHIHNFTTGRDEVYFFLPQIARLSLPEGDYGKPGTNSEKSSWQCKFH